jgi:hypothetical protein
MDRFRSLGLALCQELLKDECDRLAAGAPEGADGTHLVFKIDKSLAYLPLEMMHDGRDFLSRRFAVGRVIYAETSGVRGGSRREPPHTVLIVGDPSEDAAICGDVEAEIDALREVFRGVEGYSPRIAVGDEADAEYILSNLPGAAVFHFSGHGVVSEEDQQTGLRLASETILSGYSLQGLQDAPAFAFLNVCTPASRETWKGSLGIIETLLRRGTRACISSLWAVRSRAAATLASHFYANLLRGGTFGEALRLARIATAAETPAGDPTWAAYALYGDPRMTLENGVPLAESARERAERRRRQVRVFAPMVLAGLVMLVTVFIASPPRRPADTPLEPAAESTGTGGGRSATEEAGQSQAMEVGYLVIESSPRSADILIDGKRIGVTPYAAEVPVGMHEVVIEKQGYRRWEASVEVKPSPRATVNASLERIK